MKIALTGTDGFIAKHLHIRLSLSHDVDCFDFKGNYKSPFALLEKLEKNYPYDLIIHFGANSNAHVDRPHKNWLENTLYSNSLAILSAKANTPFIFSSSYAVYGDHTGVGNLSPYATSKFETESFLQQLATDFVSWRFACLRLTNVFGKYESHKGEMKSIPCRFVEDARLNKKIEVWASKITTMPTIAQRDFLSVEDLSEIIEGLVNSFIWKQEILDIGSGTPTSILDVARIIQEQLPCEIEVVPLPEDVVSEKYQIFTKANLTRLREIMPNFKPKPLVESLSILCRNS